MNRQKRRIFKIRIFFCIVLILIALCSLCFNQYIIPLLKVCVADSASSQLNITINQAINEIVSENQQTFSGIVSVVYDNNNCVKAVESDAVKLNNIKSIINATLTEKTRAIDKNEVPISVVTLTNNEFLLGRGFKLPFKYDIENLTIGEFQEQFTSVGINQTKYTVSLKITTKINILIPFNMQHTTLSNDVIIASTVIIGEIPQTYINVN